MMVLLMILICYAAVGTVVWMTEDIRLSAGWREFIFWPVVVWDWLVEIGEWVYKKLR